MSKLDTKIYNTFDDTIETDKESLFKDNDFLEKLGLKTKTQIPYSKDKICFKCGIPETEADLIIHHTSYIPEKTVLCCHSCHKSIHNRIKRQNQCCYTKEEIAKMSINSSSKRYFKKAYYVFNFYDKIERNAYLVEQIFYNKNTGNAFVFSNFNLINTKTGDV